MIDLHTHILPKTDDGAKNPEISIAMLQSAAAQGVSLCVATPHCVIHKDSDVKSFVERRERKYALLKEAIDADGRDFPEILFGAEVFLDNDISRYPDIDMLCMADTKRMLIELAPAVLDPHYIDWIYSLYMQGVKPLIAHVDRYTYGVELIHELRDMDVIYQINADSFLSFAARRNFAKLMKTGARFIVSSDMHNMTSRTCNMGLAYQKAKKKYPLFADGMFHNNAQVLLKGI